jgi:hypothetical protein
MHIADLPVASVKVVIAAIVSAKGKEPAKGDCSAGSL